MKACLYSPYLPGHYGGGEKYLLDVAVALAERYQVFIATPHQITDPNLKKSYEQFFNIDLGSITFITSPLGTQASFSKKLWWTKQFDLLYYVTDGSLFFSLAKKNILHFQIPFTHFANTILNRCKLANWQVKNTNSSFTKSVIEKHWPLAIDVVHHPMIVSQVNAEEQSQLLKSKEKVIVSVGRFFRQLHSKRQDILIAAFRQLLSVNPAARDWKLVLIGGIEDKEYVAQLHQEAHDLPIEFYHHLSKKELSTWYQKASIYWHAAGYKIDEAIEPEKVEHFGITTVEAMSYGLVPVVVGKGGQLEVLGQDLQSFLWQTLDECVSVTSTLITNHVLRKDAQLQALHQAKSFGPEKFMQKLWQMVAQ